MNIRFTKILFLLFAVLLCVVNSSAQSTGSDRKIVRVGYYPIRGYFEYDSEGRRTGYGYEYLQQIADYTGWKYQFIDCDLASCQEKLQNGEIDLLAPFLYTKEQEAKFEFSKTNIGSSYGILSVRIDDDRYTSGDYEKYNDIRVGLILGSILNDQFLQFCRDNKFQVKTTFYQTEEELREGLWSGQVDAIVKSAEMKLDDEKVIEQFNPNLQYFILRKGNVELRDELDDAISRLKMNDPMMEARLYSKYYSDNNSILVLSKQEKEYLKEKGKIRAVALSVESPMLEQFDGEYSGVLGDLMRHFSDDLGIEIELVPTGTENGALMMAATGVVDIVLDIQHDYNLAEENNLKLTPPYISIPYCSITQKESIQNDPSVAALNGYYYINYYIESIYPSEKITYYDTEKEIIQAVKNGKQDIAYVNCLLAGSLQKYLEYRDLILNLTTDLTQDISIGISNLADPLLYPIINKEIKYLGITETNNIMTRNMINQESRLTLEDVVHQNPRLIIGISVILLLSLTVLMIERHRTNQKVQKHITELAFGDQLTGLRNLAWLEEKGSQILLNSEQQSYAIIAFDVLRFDVINEYYGREVGDKIIKYIAQTVSREINMSGAVLIRVKADHFLCLTPFDEREELTALIINIRDKYNYYQEGETEIKFNLIFGAYLIPDNNFPITSAIDYAEIARKEARINTSSISFFDEKMREKMNSEKALEDIQEQSLLNGEFKLYFQPKIDMRDGKIVGAEALVRWANPEKGFMLPNLFIPLFERNRFIITLDFYVLEEVYKMIQRRLNSGLKVVPVSVNQSRSHLTEEQYIEDLQKLRSRYNIPDGFIELELTETAFSEMVNIHEVLRKAKELGFQIAIDDFGTGFSSLTMLNDNSLDVLKIDKSFLEKSLTSEKTRNIILKTVEMAHALNMQVIAEGVETQEQAQFLMSVGCNFAQGYLYSKPVSQEDFEAKLDLI